MPEPEISRRTFLLDTLLGGSLFISTCAGATTVFQFMMPPKRGFDSAKASVLACRDEDLPEGSSKDVLFQDAPALVFKHEGKILAFKSKCPHLGCLVKWDRSKKMLLCPCHNGVFDLDGNVVSGPPPKPLTKLTVTVRESKIFLGG
jgi:cytochrome b6-f complex iron-sulfur subunit